MTTVTYSGERSSEPQLSYVHDRLTRNAFGINDGTERTMYREIFSSTPIRLIIRERYQFPINRRPRSATIRRSVEWFDTSAQNPSWIEVPGITDLSDRCFLVSTLGAAIQWVADELNVRLTLQPLTEIDLNLRPEVLPPTPVEPEVIHQPADVLVCGDWELDTHRLFDVEDNVAVVLRREIGFREVLYFESYVMKVSSDFSTIDDPSLVGVMSSTMYPNPTITEGYVMARRIRDTFSLAHIKDAIAARIGAPNTSTYSWTWMGRTQSPQDVFELVLGMLEGRATEARPSLMTLGTSIGMAASGTERFEAWFMEWFKEKFDLKVTTDISDGQLEVNVAIVNVETQKAIFSDSDTINLKE